MTVDLFTDTTRSDALRQIAQDVAVLSLPSLAPLLVTLHEIRANAQQRRAALRLDAQGVRGEGFAAAARLSLSLTEDAPVEAADYFGQLVKGVKP